MVFDENGSSVRSGGRCMTATKIAEISEALDKIPAFVQCQTCGKEYKYIGPSTRCSACGQTASR
jgi:Zn finger protein HypA/HybF involved in hydrogenase expression